MFCIAQRERERETVIERERQNNKGHWHRLTEKAKPDAKSTKIYRWWVRDDDDNYVWSCARVCMCVCASIFVCVRLKCACLRGLRSAEVGCSTWAAALFAECWLCLLPLLSSSLFYSQTLKSNKLQLQLRKWPTPSRPYKSRQVRTCKWAKQKETEAGQQN